MFFIGEIELVAGELLFRQPQGMQHCHTLCVKKLLPNSVPPFRKPSLAGQYALSELRPRSCVLRLTSDRHTLDSHGAAGRGAGGPSPLEVEAAEMAGDIHDFTYKEEPGDVTRFHGFAGKFIGVHTAGGDFGFFITFGSCRCDDPFVNLTLESFERLIRPIGWSVEIKPAHGKTVRENSLQRGAHGRDIADFA